MDDGVRARVEAGGEREATRVNQEGEVAAGGATFRFSIDRPRSDDDDASGFGTDDLDADGNREATADDPRYVAPLDDVPTNGTIRCEALGGRRGVEFILREEAGEAFAWRNSCPHEPEVRLDPGWGAFVREGRIVCHEHGARFECEDGLCTYGPCRGKTLEPIGVEVREGAVYLSDERFEACRRLR